MVQGNNSNLFFANSNSNCSCSVALFSNENVFAKQKTIKPPYGKTARARNWIYFSSLMFNSWSFYDGKRDYNFFVHFNFPIFAIKSYFFDMREKGVAYLIYVLIILVNLFLCIQTCFVIQL